MRKSQLVLLALFILLSVGAGYVAPLIFLKWGIFILFLIFVFWKFSKAKNDSHANRKRTLLFNLIIAIALGFISVPITDLAKAKRNAVVCPYSTFHKSDYLAQGENEDAFDISLFNSQIEKIRTNVSVTSDSILYQNKYYQFTEINSKPESFVAKVLVLAGVHGDEPAGVLSIPVLLDQMENRDGALSNTAIQILCPVNPIGFTLKSRENECGCNINRDYSNPSQIETKKVIESIEKFHPDLIIDLHENNGNWETCLMANKLFSDEMGKRICEKLTSDKIALTDFAFDTRLPFPGWLRRSYYREKINQLAGLSDLMWYGQTKVIPVITLECDQSLPLVNRISICKRTVEYVLAEFNHSRK